MGAFAAGLGTDDVVMPLVTRTLKGRKPHFDEALFFEPEEGCNYAAHHVINLADVKPLIALYPSPDNCVSVQEKFGMKLDGCFVRACTTTQEDLVLAAMVLQQAMLVGKRPSTNGNRRVTSGSLEIIDQLEELGLVRVYEEAGFTVGVPSCSFCLGIGADVAGENEVWLSSQNRNFRNRMGKGSLGNLSSAAVLAASSFDMEVVDSQSYLDKIKKDDFDSYRNWVESDPSTSSPAKTTKSYKVFGDNIDTDAVIPAHVMGLNKSSPLWPAECETELDVLAAKSFAYVRPEFPQKVKDGFNIIVAGTAFGSGSSREEPLSAGVQAVIAKSFAYIYARNQANDALLGIVVTDEKFHELASEGEEVTVDLRTRVVSVNDHQVAFSLTQLEEAFLNGGGLKNLFKQHKAELFRAAMRGKVPKPIASSGVGYGDDCGSTAASSPSW
ncbi:unnamed protein product [Peronospora destructor]|uniref:Aconitase/3-isopropylmalate dehydratase large subunit alpha/beta/alpha domain-containing protein n=1 Tax=Peronospora destructor TaxID=86335 RepID=A0AAV0V7C8_9STRA|nr:unnamed protein product [Peronospora destructor]